MKEETISAMIYNYENVYGRTLVFDVDTMTEIKKVQVIDTDTGSVYCCHDPVQIIGDSVATFTLRYRSIYPISGIDPLPSLFHCYGRIE